MSISIIFILSISVNIATFSHTIAIIACYAYSPLNWQPHLNLNFLNTLFWLGVNTLQFLFVCLFFLSTNSELIHWARQWTTKIQSGIDLLIYIIRDWLFSSMLRQGTKLTENNNSMFWYRHWTQDSGYRHWAQDSKFQILLWK